MITVPKAFGARALPPVRPEFLAMAQAVQSSFNKTAPQAKSKDPLDGQEPVSS